VTEMAGITQQLEAATGLPWWVTIVLAVLLLIIIVLIVALCRSHSHNKAGELVIPKAPATGGDPFDGTGKAVDPHSPNGMTPSASDSDETAPLAGNATAALSDGADFEEDFEEVSALAEDSAGKANAADGEAADASAGVSGDDASDAADEAAEVATTSDANVGGDVADAADETAVGNDSKADADADSDAGEAALQTAAAAASEDALGAAAPDAEAAGESATDANASTEGAPAESTDASSDDPSKLRVIDDKAGDAELYKAVGGSHARVTQSAFGIDFGFLEEYEEEYERALAEFRRLRKKNEEELQGESNHEQHEESE
jgi:hypothetical protein